MSGDLTSAFAESIGTMWDSEEEEQMHLMDADAVAIFLAW